MKSFIVFALFVAAAAAAPVNPDGDAVIVKYDSDNIGVEGYNFAYETSNGIKQEETAQLVDRGTEDEGISVRGAYSYPGPDGVVYVVTYLADKNGFQPNGDHIPKA
ncbi:flexible cuticle protein 12-like [Maniola hyperantus]|uniref:flexible cuticle protein 12-like n=1 Tax=Aphantopus hyperantus TaxID=2795564 RepID=UPI00156829F3|nr:flexible cuticle protein 12-like [Maniola hyperantus]